MSDTTQSILKSARLFFSGTMLSRISGMLRDMAMAYAFGTHASVAAFLVAFRLSHLLRRLFGEGALQSAFIPQFEELRTKSSEEAFGFFRSLTAALSLLLIVIIAASSAVLGAVWFWGDLSQGNQEIVSLTLLLLPSLLFICLFGLNSSLLQCEKSYFIPSFAPVAFNLIWIAGVFVVQGLSIQTSMRWLAGWVLLACMGQWGMTLPAVLKILKQQYQRYSLQKIKFFIRPLLLGIIGVAATQVNSALDALFARYAESEGPAMLWYALRIQQLPLALFGVAIAGAVLPPMTRALKSGNQTKYVEFLSLALSRTIFLMLPITIFLSVMGDSLVTILYGRGDFGGHSIMGTTHCLWGYNLGLLPMVLILVLAPAFYAQGNQRTPALGSILAVALNVILNALFIFKLGFGAISIALATSVSAWANFFFLAYLLEPLRALIPKLLVELTQAFVASSLAGAAILLISSSHLPQNILIQFAMQIAVFGIVWASSNSLLKAAQRFRKGVLSSD